MKSIDEIIDILNFRGYLRFIPDIVWLKYKFKKVFKKKLNLKNPLTFNEKMQWMKLYYKNPICTQMVDKIEAKEYAKKIIGEEYIIPTIGIWENFNSIDWTLLPNQFVLKCNHDSGGLIICRNKNKLDKDKAKTKIEKCLKTNYFYHGREYVYKNIKPRILAEQYMENQNDKSLTDYKFYCFDGKVKMLYVSNGLENHMTASIGFFDENYNQLPFHRTDYNTFKDIPEKPINFNKMIEIAEKLSKGFPFLRVDLYEINRKIYFSELTFIPCSGLMTIEPKEWDYIIGSWLNLPKSNKGQ